MLIYNLLATIYLSSDSTTWVDGMVGLGRRDPEKP
jgi:hypothetical protein